jgi:hypothetical protein
MIMGRITGDYEYYYENLGAAQPVAVRQNTTATLATQIDLSEGLWLIQAFVQCSVRNLQLRTFLIVGQQSFSGVPFSEAMMSQMRESVSFVSILDDVRITQGMAQIFRINLNGGAGGGEFKDVTIVLFAFKKQEPRKRRTTTKQKKENDK